MFLTYLKSFSFLFHLTLSSSVPLVFASLGGSINENSGTVNIGLEGFMFSGAWAAVVMVLWTHNPWFSFLCAGLVSMGFAAVHAFVVICLRTDQIVAGIATNSFIFGFVIFLNRLLFQGLTTTPIVPLKLKMWRPFSRFFVHNSSSILDNFFNFYSVVYLALCTAILIWFVLYRTRLGFYIRAVGENPQIAESVGINVYFLRFLCLLASGFLAGLGGASITLSVVSSFRPTLIAGQGFIALAVIILGRWNPLLIYLGCLLFGFLHAFSIFFQSLFDDKIFSPHFMAMLSYILSFFILVFFRGRFHTPPSALGKLYVRGT